MKTLILVATLAVVNGGRLGNEGALASYGIGASLTGASAGQATACRMDEQRALGEVPTLGQDSTAGSQWKWFEPPPRSDRAAASVASSMSGVRSRLAVRLDRLLLVFHLLRPSARGSPGAGRW